jgi:hypothetical protein
MSAPPGRAPDVPAVTPAALFAFLVIMLVLFAFILLGAAQRSSAVSPLLLIVIRDGTVLSFESALWMNFTTAF